MNFARRASVHGLRSLLRLSPMFASLSLACGFDGRVELGDNGGAAPYLDDGRGGSGSGSMATGGWQGAAKGGASSAAAGGSGSSPSVVQGGAEPLGQGGAFLEAGSNRGPVVGEDPPLPMDATGEVPRSSNRYGIQGKWYAFSDEETGGRTRIDGYSPGVVPFEASQGMCIHGTTQSGIEDNWKTWGAGIGIALNVVDGRAATLVNPPPCFSVVVSLDATYPFELRADLNPTDDGRVQPANVALHPGQNDFCLSDAKTFAHCTPELDCLAPDSLNQGLAKINVVAASSGTPGPISFCIVSLKPHD